MATTVQSRKQKGRRLQQYIVDKIKELFPQLSDRDIRSTPMGVTGDDVQLSEKAAGLFPYSIEAKNVEKLNVWAALEQSSSDNRELTSLLVFKRNRSDVYCALKFDDFMSLLKLLDEAPY